MSATTWVMIFSTSAALMSLTAALFGMVANYSAGRRVTRFGFGKPGKQRRAEAVERGKPAKPLLVRPPTVAETQDDEAPLSPLADHSSKSWCIACDETKNKNLFDWTADQLHWFCPPCRTAYDDPDGTLNPRQAVVEQQQEIVSLGAAEIKIVQAAADALADAFTVYGGDGQPIMSFNPDMSLMALCKVCSAVLLGGYGLRNGDPWCASCLDEANRLTRQIMKDIREDDGEPWIPDEDDLRDSGYPVSGFARVSDEINRWLKAEVAEARKRCEETQAQLHQAPTELAAQLAVEQRRKDAR